MAQHRLAPDLVHQILALPLDREIPGIIYNQIPQAFWDDWYPHYWHLLSRNHDLINIKTLLNGDPDNQDLIRHAVLIESEIAQQHIAQFVQDW